MPLYCTVKAWLALCMCIIYIYIIRRKGGRGESYQSGAGLVPLNWGAGASFPSFPSHLSNIGILFAQKNNRKKEKKKETNKRKPRPVEQLKPR